MDMDARDSDTHNVKRLPTQETTLNFRDLRKNLNQKNCLAYSVVHFYCHYDVDKLITKHY